MKELLERQLDTYIMMTIALGSFGGNYLEQALRIEAMIKELEEFNEHADIAAQENIMKTVYQYEIFINGELKDNAILAFKSKDQAFKYARRL